MNNLKTDWDLYYTRPNAAAFLARKIVAFHLRKTIGLFYPGKRASIAELGGGDSCFAAPLIRSFEPDRYSVYDSNELAVRRFRSRAVPNTEAHLCDLLRENTGTHDFELVFSVGLIEHFSPEETARMVRAHFDFVKPGGIVILFFPTPTRLYRTTRSFAERLGLWRFPDERPLEFCEVREYIKPFGTVLFQKIIRSNFLTQQIIVAGENKNAVSQNL